MTNNSSLTVGGEPGGTQDGHQFTINDGTRTLTFEFDLDGSVTAGNYPINLAFDSSADDVANAIINGITLSPLTGITGRLDGNGQLLLETTNLHSVDVSASPSLTASGEVGGILDGQVLVLEDATQTLTLEFDSDSDVGLGHVAIAYSSNSSATDIVTDILAAAQTAGLDMTFVQLGDMNPADGVDLQDVAIDSPQTHTLDVSLSNLEPVRQAPLVLQAPANGAAGLTDGSTFTISDGNRSWTFEFDSDSNVADGNIAVPYAAGDDADAIAATILSTIQAQGFSLDIQQVAGGTLAVNGDDEDGVQFNGILNPFVSTPITVTASGTGLLDAWIDFNQDGDWNDLGEQVFASEPLAPGANQLFAQTPIDAATGITYARFRISSAGGLEATGLAADGEVEDYRVSIVAGAPPIANDDPSVVNAALYTTSEDDVLTISAADGVLMNDTDPDRDSVSVSGFTAVSAQGATIQVTTDGSFTYNPQAAANLQALNQGQSLIDTFTYTISDGNQGTDTATVSITVTGANDLPVAVDDTATVTDPTSIFAIDVLDNDFDPEGDLFFLNQIETQPTKGIVFENPNGSVSFNPNGDFDDLLPGETDTVSFTYTVTDGIGVSAPATVTVTVVGINDAPVATNNNYTLTENQTLNTGNVIRDDTGSGIDSDADGQTVTVHSINGSTVIVGQPFELATGLSVTVNQDGSFSFDPTTYYDSLTTGESAMTSFTYVITDGSLTSDPATVSFTVTGIDDPPTAISNLYAVLQTDTIQGNMIANTELTLNPGQDFDPETANNALTLSEINGATFTANTPFALPSGATLTVGANGSFLYDPSTSATLQGLGPNETMDDTFTYSMTDGTNVSNTAQVRITVTGETAPPIACSDAYDTTESVSISGNVLTDDDPGCPDTSNTGTLDVLRVNGFSGVTGTQMVLNSGATLQVNGDGTFSYDPSTSTTFNALALNDMVNDSFTYTITDGLGGTDSATVSITVTGENDGPTAVDDVYSVTRGGFLTTTDEDGRATTITIDNGILANDSDPDGDNLTITIVDEPFLDQAFTMNSNGTFSYRHNGSDPSQSDRFTYRITDAGGATATATVTINVTLSSWQNPVEHLDVNADGFISPIDALIVINRLNAFLGQSAVPLPDPPATPPPYYDVNGDGIITPQDVLLVINELNRLAGDGEGESDPLLAPATSRIDVSSATTAVTASEDTPRSDTPMVEVPLLVAVKEPTTAVEAAMADSAVDSVLDDVLDDIADDVVDSQSNHVVDSAIDDILGMS